MLFAFLFPGVVFHELAHFFACILVGVKVLSVKLFDAKEAFVEHEKPNAWQSIVITLAPFVLNNFFGYWLMLFANDLVKFELPLALVFYWLSIALFFHSFPSDADAMNAFNATKAACHERLMHGKIDSRVLWLLISPFIFIPVMLLTGFLLIFDKSDLFKVFWVFLAVLFSIAPNAFFSLIDNIFI